VCSSDLDITLWPLGGMARMDHIPEQPKVEALVAIAGPAVNFLLAAGTLAALIAMGVLQLSVPAVRQWLESADWLGQSAVVFIVYNLFLGTFNLVPAFPMDGGRVLRATIGAFRDWVRATEIAVTVGRWVAFLMFALGVFLLFRWGFNGFALSLVLIALFVGWAGTRELWAVRMRHGRFPFGGLAGEFGGVRFQFGGQAPGASAREPADAPPRPAPPPSNAVDPETGARRPTTDWRSDGFGRERIGDDAVAKLERFQGRLAPGRDEQE
jgi:hypothetical protein